MMIDVSTIQSLELIQNIREPRSKNCLFGLLDHTKTAMGARMLRTNILQPTTLKDTTLKSRYDALEELTTSEDMFVEIRKGRVPAFFDLYANTVQPSRGSTTSRKC